MKYSDLKYKSALRDADTAQLESLLVEVLYRAAYNADYWPNALNTLCRLCGAQAASLAIVDTLTLSKPFSCQVGVPLHMNSTGELLSHCIPLSIVQDNMEESDFYHWFFLKPEKTRMNEWGDSILQGIVEGLQQLRSEQYMACLFLQHSRGQCEFSWVNSSLLNLLKTHLKLAVLLFAKSHQDLVTAQLESDIFEHFNMGVAFANSCGKVVYHNSSALTLFNARDGVYLSADGIISTQLENNCLLWTHIHKAIEQQVGGIQTITRPSGKLAYQLCYLPVDDKLRKLAGKPVALLLLFDPTLTSDAFTNIIELAYGLSKTESRLATLISRGMSVDEYSASSEVSISTVRTQLRAIYKKTATKGQVELVHLLRGLELLNLTDSIRGGEPVKQKRKRKRKPIDLSQFMLPNKQPVSQTAQVERKPVEES